MYHIFFYSFICFLLYIQKFLYSYGQNAIDKYIPNNNFNDYKKKYIVKNIFKSVLLFFLFFMCTIPIIDGFILNNWSCLSFHIIGSFYMAVDLGGIIYIRGLPRSTVIHHTSVTVMGLLNIILDYNVNGYYRSFLLYGYFSCIPFIVNFYLGSRYIIQDELIKKRIAYYSYIIYTLSLVINILCEIVLFYNAPFNYTIIIYLVILGMIFNDDIVLITFLYNVSK
jgi:hypothetical protein